MLKLRVPATLPFQVLVKAAYSAIGARRRVGLFDEI
jgi:hypothetical protein